MMTQAQVEEMIKDIVAEVDYDIYKEMDYDLMQSLLSEVEDHMDFIKETE